MTYGNQFSGDGLHNIPVGGVSGIEVAFRFLAQDTVPVNKLRFFNAYSHVKPGYHSGTGGTLLVELVTCTDTGVPLDRVLASAVVDRPVDQPAQLLVEFGSTAILSKGWYYAVRFRNVHQSPESEWVSVNALATLSKRPRRAVPGSLETLVRWKGDQVWKPFKPEIEAAVPIFCLYYAVSDQLQDGIAVPGCGVMESWVAEPRRIAGMEKVRQVFAPLCDVTTRSVMVRVAKNGNPGPLKAQLSTGTTPLGDCVVDASAVKPVDLTLLSPNRLGHDWVEMVFPGPVRLVAGKEHRLSLSAPIGDAYEVFPVRDGSEFGYASVWPQSYAECFTPKSNLWEPWSAWGKKSQQGRLQMYFKTEGGAQ